MRCARSLATPATQLRPRLPSQLLLQRPSQLVLQRPSQLPSQRLPQRDFRLQSRQTHRQLQHPLEPRQPRADDCSRPTGVPCPHGQAARYATPWLAGRFECRRPARQVPSEAPSERPTPVALRFASDSWPPPMAAVHTRGTVGVYRGAVATDSSAPPSLELNSPSSSPPFSSLLPQHILATFRRRGLTGSRFTRSPLRTPPSSGHCANDRLRF